MIAYLRVTAVLWFESRGLFKTTNGSHTERSRPTPCSPSKNEQQQKNGKKVNIFICLSGYYYCLAENPLGRAKSTVVHVTANPVAPPRGTRPPTFTRSPENELPSVGSTVTFQCAAEGVPEPTIVWTKNAELMPNQTGRGELVIHNIGVGDVANYACNASNVAGYEYKDVYLNVLTVVAVIKEGPRSQIVSKGSNVTM